MSVFDISSLNTVHLRSISDLYRVLKSFSLNSFRTAFANISIAVQCHDVFDAIYEKVYVYKLAFHQPSSKPSLIRCPCLQLCILYIHTYICIVQYCSTLYTPIIDYAFVCMLDYTHAFTKGASFFN